MATVLCRVCGSGPWEIVPQDSALAPIGLEQTRQGTRVQFVDCRSTQPLGQSEICPLRLEISPALRGPEYENQSLLGSLPSAEANHDR